MTVKDVLGVRPPTFPLSLPEPPPWHMQWCFTVWLQWCCQGACRVKCLLEEDLKSLDLLATTLQLVALLIPLLLED